MNRFEGKSVIVTGAASGFGTAIAKKFANEGAQVICADLNIDGAATSPRRLRTQCHSKLMSQANNKTKI